MMNGLFFVWRPHTIPEFIIKNSGDLAFFMLYLIDYFHEEVLI